MSRRARVLGVVGLMLTCAAVWYVVHRPAPLALAATIGGRLELAAGDVRVERDGHPEPTISGMPLPNHAAVRTGQGARALLRLLGGASAFLGDATSLKVEGSGVDLASGRIWLDVPALPEPAVHQIGELSVAVTSAGLSIERRADRIEVYVARGTAVVTAAKSRREVASGERAILEPGGQLRLEPVSFWDDWTGGMADRGMHGHDSSGSGTLYAVDRNGAPGVHAHSLSVKQQSVRARIADGVAETEVDQTFWNASDRPVEGYYWFTVPERALVTGFALETNGVLVEGEVVERKEAAARYEAAIASANDPALLEWISDRTYRARIFPIPAVGTRRVVLRYVEPIALGDGRMRWVYPMTPSEDESATIDELSLSLDLGALGPDSVISTLPDARVEDGGRRITMRRSVYTPHGDFQVELAPKRALPAFRATRFAAGGGDQADFVMLRWVPDVDWSTVKNSTADIVLAVDVSAGGDDADRQLEASVTEAILRNLAAGDHFALMTTDIVPRVIYPASGLASADAAHVAEALERLASAARGGATDLGAMFEPGLSLLHGTEQPALVYVGDGRATSGELRGAELVERLRRSLEGARARFFSIGVGEGVNHALLERLAAVGGGTHLRVDEAALAIPRALQLTAAVKTPTITDLVLDAGVGLDEPLSNAAGKLARGQELMLLARTHHDLPSQIAVRGRLDGKPFTRSYDLKLETDAATTLVPRFWAAELVRRQLGRAANPDEARSKVVALALEYGLVTPFSSILALDAESSYPQMGIPRRHRPWDRLPEARAQLEDRTPLQTALAVALAPVSLLSGCNSSDSVATRPASMARQELGKEAPAEPAKDGRTNAAFGAPAEADVGNQAAAPAPTPPSAAAAPAEAEMADMAARGAEKKAESAPEPMMALGYREGGGTRLGTDARSYGPARHTKARLQIAAPAPQPPIARPVAARSRPRPRLYVATSICSDAASRPLSDRQLLWQRRLRSAHTMSEVLALYDAARAACEAGTQQDQRALLSLLPPYATSADAAEQLFAHFTDDPDAAALLVRHVLRRTLDPYVAAIARRQAQVDGLDWSRVDLELAAMPNDEARIARLRNLLLASPTDMDAQLRLMKFLVRTGKRSEAIPMAARLRERGLFSPSLLRELGDIQLAAGLRDDALRTYTEIVEFDPDSSAARELVGDTLLEHGWYDVAYRQFRTLALAAPERASSQIRLALAAAGSGRIDEALRVLRSVAETDAEPGANDPRLQARMIAAALVARLLADAGNDGTRSEALARQLKQLQVLPAPGRLCVLTWEALDESLGFGAPVGDLIDAPTVGLVALGGPEISLQALAASITLRSEHKDRASGEPLRWKLHELSFDGKSFQVKVIDGQAG